MASSCRPRCPIEPDTGGRRHSNYVAGHAPAGPWSKAVSQIPAVATTCCCHSHHPVQSCFASLLGEVRTELLLDSTHQHLEFDRRHCDRHGQDDVARPTEVPVQIWNRFARLGRAGPPIVDNREQGKRPYDDHRGLMYNPHGGSFRVVAESDLNSLISCLDRPDHPSDLQ